jgi:hypothetical protein
MAEPEQAMPGAAAGGSPAERPGMCEFFLCVLARASVTCVCACVCACARMCVCVCVLRVRVRVACMECACACAWRTAGDPDGASATVWEVSQTVWGSDASGPGPGGRGDIGLAHDSKLEVPATHTHTHTCTCTCTCTQTRTHARTRTHLRAQAHKRTRTHTRTQRRAARNGRWPRCCRAASRWRGHGQNHGRRSEADFFLGGDRDCLGLAREPARRPR